DHLQPPAHAAAEDPAAPGARAGTARAAFGRAAGDVARAAHRSRLPPLHAADVLLRRRQSHHDADTHPHHVVALRAAAAAADADHLVHPAAADDADHPAVVAHAR